MATPQDSIRLYRQLAEEHHRQNHPQDRDRFLLLAADAALTAGQADEAERLRKSLLAQNPHHLLRPYATLGEALESQDIKAYVEQLRRSYPHDRAELMLKGLQKPGSKGTEASDDMAAPLDARTKVTKPMLKPVSSKPAILATPTKRETQPAPKPPKPLTPPPPLPRASTFKMLPEPKVRAQTPPPVDARATTTSADDDAELSAGNWVGSVLFLLGLVAFVAVMAWAVAKPFLP